MFQSSCVSAIYSFWVDKFQGSMLLFMAQFFSHRIHPKCTQNRLLIQQLRLQSFSLLFSHRKSLSEDWMKIGMLKKICPQIEIQKQKKTLVFWSMDVCSSYKSLKEPTDLEERLHKEESHSEDPPPFSAPHCSPWNGPSRTLSRRKLRYWYLEVASFLVLHGDS